MQDTLTNCTMGVMSPLRRDDRQPLVLGNRIPRDYFITRGRGESDITVHAGSYHLALRDAGIEMCNIITYSSILPAIAREITRPEIFTHGSVMETIMAVATAGRGKRATAGIIYGWLADRRTGEKHGGLVCEYNGPLSSERAAAQLQASLQELYTNGYSDDFQLSEPRMVLNSLIPEKRYGTALVALCFVSYVWPAAAWAG